MKMGTTMERMKKTGVCPRGGDPKVYSGNYNDANACCKNFNFWPGCSQFTIFTGRMKMVAISAKVGESGDK